MEDNSEEYRKDLQKRVKQDPVRRETDSEMWDKVLGGIEAIEKQERRIPFYWYASAASVIIILSASLTYFYYYKKTGNTSSVIVQNIEKKKIQLTPDKDTSGTEKPFVKTDAGRKSTEVKPFNLEVFISSDKTSSHQLSDGSEITLNVSGNVSIKTFQDKNLAIDLIGEAYFDVVPGLKRSFKVYFDSSKLEVIGTRFSVRNILGESMQEVIVSEGIVRVTTKNRKEVILKKGSFLQIEKTTGAYKIKDVNPSHYLSWKTGNLNFSDTPMPEVAAVLSRVYRKSIVVENSIKSCTFTGDLSHMSLEDALKVIEATTSTEINRNTEHVIKISGASCN